MPESSIAFSTRRRDRAFTLVELLVVIGIIAVLIAMLLPVLGKARQTANSLKCLSNLKTLGAATAMYVGANRGTLPYPTSTFPAGTPEAQQAMIWFNALDPYLKSAAHANNNPAIGGHQREYDSYKQCPVWETFPGAILNGKSQGQRGFAKTYKMNSHLRERGKPARITDVPQPSAFVYLGDGTSLDEAGDVDNQWESGQFSMEVNETQDGTPQATPALRHLGGANILFVDGHAENIKLPTTTKKLRAPQANVTVKCWESEYYVASAKKPYAPKVDDFGKYSMQQLGIRRNDNMPLVWSVWGRLYRFAATED